MFKNVLVLSPHQDDEVLGVGGTLLQCKDIHIHYFNRFHPAVDSEIYDREAENVQRSLRCNVSYSGYMSVNKLHTFPIVNYIIEIEQLLNSFMPDTIFIPSYSRNQDHRVVYDAAITAIRFHDTNWFVPNALVYEQNEYMNSSFTPNVFVEIDMDKKLELVSLYKSQQRGHRKPIHLRALAVLRGMEINKPFAEAFMAVRLCPSI